MALFCDRFVSLISNDEDACGGFNDVVGDGVELVDLENAIDLREESFEQSRCAVQLTCLLMARLAKSQRRCSSAIGKESDTRDGEADHVGVSSNPLRAAVVETVQREE